MKSFVMIGIDKTVKEDFDKLKADVEKNASERSGVKLTLSATEFLSVLCTTYRSNVLGRIEERNAR